MKISFVIPSYNSAEWLPHAVDSVLTQTHKDVECVIVNDASTDSTEDYLSWLEKQGDKRVVILRNEKNLGRSASRNKGNKAAKGKVICVLDADDVCSPQRAALTAARFEKGAKFVHGAAHTMDAVGHDLGMEPTDIFNRDKAVSTMLNRIVHSTVAYTKDLALRFPYSDGDVAKLGIDDWEQQIRMAFDGVEFTYIPTPLAAYRQGVGISVERDQEKVAAFKKAYLETMTAGVKA